MSENAKIIMELIDIDDREKTIHNLNEGASMIVQFLALLAEGYEVDEVTGMIAAMYA